MKTTPILLSMVCAAGFLCAPQALVAQASHPTGELSVNTDLVRQGVKPKLTWSVVYPDLPFDPPTQKTTEDVTIFVSVFGVAYENSSGEVAVSSQLKIGGKWFNLFSGKGSQVDPSRVIFSMDVDKGTEIVLGAYGGYDWRYSGDTHVVVLKNGDIPPNYAPAYDQGDIVSFLSSYIGSDGKISIGPKDVIYLAELYSTKPGSYYYDMQDIVVHVRFVERTTVTISK